MTFWLRCSIWGWFYSSWSGTAESCWHFVTGRNSKRIFVNVSVLYFLCSSLILAFLRLLLIEYVAATASGHNAENAMVRKDKRKLPIPVRSFLSYSCTLLGYLFVQQFCCWRYRPTKVCSDTPLSALKVIHLFVQAYFMYTLKVGWYFHCDALLNYLFLISKWSVLQYVIIRPGLSQDSNITLLIRPPPISGPWRRSLRLEWLIDILLPSCINSGHNLREVWGPMWFGRIFPSLCQGLPSGNWFCQHKVRRHTGSVWTIPIASKPTSSVALYGLLLFYGLTKDELVGRRPLAKFLCIKLIVMATFYQAFMVSSQLFRTMFYGS
jgi:Organic solute transporter Ostalpha